MPNLAVTSPGHAQCQVTQFRKLRFYSETYILVQHVVIPDPYQLIMVLLMMIMMRINQKMMMMLMITMMMLMITMMMMMMMMMMIRASRRYFGEL